MRAIEARQIPIQNILERHGFKPSIIRNSVRGLVSHRPLRAGDITPSFKVDTHKKLRFDHGIARGGNVIDLVCELQNISVKEALAFLEDTGLYRGVYLAGRNPALFAEKSERQLAGEKEKKNIDGLVDTGKVFQVRSEERRVGKECRKE